MKRWPLTVWAVAVVVLVAGCGGGSDKGPSATIATPTTHRSTTSTTLSPEAEVEAAYLKSWDVYTDAMRTFDTSHLDEVYVDDALKLRLDEVSDLARKNTPGRMKVVHAISVKFLDNGQVVVRDNYINHSVLLDGTTREPIEQDPNRQVRYEYPMRRVNGTWKVWAVLIRR